MKELYSEKEDDVTGAVWELWQDDQSYKSTLAKQWELNVHYYNGLQNINFANILRSPDGQILLPRSDPEGNLYVSNEIGPAGRAIISFITRSKPSVEVFGVENSDNSKLKAYIAEKIHEAKYDLDDEHMNSIRAAEWGFTTGTAVRKDWWDHSYGTEPEIPVFDEYGDEVLDPETGKVLTRKIGAGRNRVTILPPFTIAVDPSCTSPRDIERIIEGYLAPIDWVRKAFDQDKPGYYPENARNVSEGGTWGDTINRVEDLKYSVSLTQAPYASRPPLKGKTLVLEAYMEPTRDFPRGRMVVIAGGKIVYMSPPKIGSPYYMPVEPMMWHPYSFFIYEPYVGRMLGKSAVEQVLSLQMRMNEINGSVLRNANTLAQPNIIAAENQLKRGTMQGGGAKIWTFTEVPSGFVPQVFNGAQLPPQFFEELRSLVDRMVRILGTNFVMQGEAPRGVSAAAAISQILENANTQQSPIVQSFENFHSWGFTNKLRLLRRFNYVPMKDLNDYLRNIVRGSLRTERDAFTREDLSDGIGVKVQNGSMMSKSDLVKRSTYLDFAKQGILGPIAEDSPRGAKLRNQLFEVLGEKPLKTEDSVEVQKAEWENDRISQGLPVEVDEFDVDEIHIPCHLTQYQDPHYIETASPEERGRLLEHIEAHKQKQAAKMLSAMPPAPGVNPETIPAGMPPQGLPSGIPTPPVAGV